MIRELVRNPGRELTPEEHRWIRRQLVLLPAYLWLAYGWINLLLRLPLYLPGSDVQIVRDFIHFYVQGVVALQHNARALYDMDAMGAMVPGLVPGAHEARFPPVYGPQVSVFFSVLARLPYNPALFTWLALSAAAYGVCVFAIWRMCPRLQAERPTVWLLALASPALHFDLKFSQAAAIGLVCVTLAFIALKKEQRFLCGVAIGMLAYKPPLGVAAAILLVVAREGRMIAGAATTVAAQLAIGSAYWGTAILRDYVEALVSLPQVAAGMEPYKYHMHSWRSFFQLLGLPEAVVWPLFLLMALATLVVAFRVWRGTADAVCRYAALMLATVLVDPHLYVYDLLLLTPMLLLLWDWTIAHGRDRTLVVLLYLSYLAPLLGGFAEFLRVQASVLVFFALLIRLMRTSTAFAESPAVEPAA